MALISMAVWDTEENNRSELTKKCLFSLLQTVDFSKHELFISDNGSCNETQLFYSEFKECFDSHYYPDKLTSLTIYKNYQNLGTAEAVNIGWQNRRVGENCIKMDNDCIIHQQGWVDEMEEAIVREPKIGILGLKRVDLEESPNNPHPFYTSELVMLPHTPGQRWVMVEKVKHVMGTCQMYSSALLDKIGYLYQPNLYGFDDSLAAVRCNVAGFNNYFLPYILISHLDNGAHNYQAWKQEHAGRQFTTYNQIVSDYRSGKQSVYYNPFKK